MAHWQIKPTQNGRELLFRDMGHDKVTNCGHCAGLYEDHLVIQWLVEHATPWDLFTSSTGDLWMLQPTLSAALPS